MKTIHDDFRQQMSDLKKNEDKITVTEWKSKMATIRKDHHEKVQNVLTSEQKASLKKMMQEHKGAGRHHGARNLDRMKKDLNLTDDQVAALKKNHEDMAQQFKALREDKNLTADQKKVEMKKFRDQQHESLKSILTPEQLQKLEQEKKEHKQAAQGRGLQS
jgi:Spy/CpxP family protein refolding chaperone